MSNNSKIFFQPWVGSDYNTGGVFGKKVLVLGESHYGDAPDQTDDTIGTIKEFVYDFWGESYQQTFLCFERALAGRERLAKRSVSSCGTASCFTTSSRNRRPDLALHPT